MNIYELIDPAFTSNLFGQAFLESGSFMLWAAAVIFIRILTSLFPASLRTGTGALLFAFQMYILHRDNILSEIFVSFMLALLMSVSLYLMKIMKIERCDILYLSACLLFSRRLFSSSFALFGYGIEYLIIIIRALVNHFLYFSAATLLCQQYAALRTKVLEAASSKDFCIVQYAFFTYPAV